jgi:hypothetical protein
MKSKPHKRQSNMPPAFVVHFVGMREMGIRKNGEKESGKNPVIESYPFRDFEEAKRELMILADEVFRDLLYVAWKFCICDFGVAAFHKPLFVYTHFDYISSREGIYIGVKSQIT